MSSAEPSSPSTSARQPPTPRALRITAWAATIGVVLALVGLALLLRPVTTPVQDCGTTLAFMLDGRVDEFGDPEDPPPGLSAAEVDEANARPCRVRVADAARPGLVLGAAGVVVAVSALIVEVAVRVNGWRRRRSARSTGRRS